MPNTMPNTPVRTPANSLRSEIDQIRSAKAPVRTDANSVENTPKSRRASARLVRSAMRECGLTQKAFALAAAQSESVISESLSGEDGRNLAFSWLLDQDSAFLMALWDEISRDRGITPQSRRQEKVRLVVTLIAQLLDLVEEPS